MAKKKAQKETEPTEVADIEAEHKRLKDRVFKLRTDKAIFTDGAGEQFVSRVCDTIDREIADSIADLEQVAKADLEKRQGAIGGLRRAKQIITGSGFDSDLEDAENALAAFEEQSALLIQSGGDGSEDGDGSDE